MATELKACPFCGSDELDAWFANIYCEKCGANLWGVASWNRRAMPECVREMLDAELRTDDPSFDLHAAADAVRKYYGEGGE